MKNKFFSFLMSFALATAFAQAPAGYYNGTASLTGAPLKSALKTIITNGHQDLGYGGLWIGYQTTDRDNISGISGLENDGSILDIYSENPNGTDPYNFIYNTNQCGNYAAEGDCYNREHIVPQSLFNENSPMVSDIHFIRATDGKVNGMRSNYPFGKVGTASFTSLNGSKLGTSVSSGYSGTVFEPIDAFKGDVARMIFYFVTRYETQLSGFSSGNMLGSAAYPGLQTWELNQLLAWNTLDPVSATEVARNNASYTYQGNRNPYIDNPAFVDLVWGSPVVDTQSPTAATNLIANNPTANTISLSWTAATDNIGVSGYDIYKNSVYYSTVTGTSATVSGLAPSTTYQFYVIARDAAGNSSPQSNIATETTIAGQPGGTCGTEDFTAIPSSGTSYATQTWTTNGITWIATDARTDQSIVDNSNNKAITIRNGNLSSSIISGGIGSLTVTAALKFSGSSSNLNVLINDVQVGTIPYTSTSTTPTTISNINISGNAIIKIVNPTTGNRVAIDDLSWTCFSNLATNETVKNKKSITIYPNPIKNHELFINGENLNKVTKAEIFDLSGKLLQIFTHPFKDSNKINLHGLPKGIYILKTDQISTKFIVE